MERNRKRKEEEEEREKEQLLGEALCLKNDVYKVTDGVYVSLCVCVFLFVQYE